MNKKTAAISIFAIVSSFTLFIFSLVAIIEPSLFSDSVYDNPSITAAGVIGIPISFLILIPSSYILFKKTKELRNSVKPVQSFNKTEKSTARQLKLYEQVDRIHKYYENGSITEEEFKELKNKILSK